ncbi:MAG: hypothetical protein AB7G93_01080 [Bdellovibrionales bacterium]
MPLKIILFIGFVFASSQGQAQSEARIKDGRQYYIELARRLDVPEKEMRKHFMELRQNLPKQKSLSDLMASVSSLGKLAGIACSEAALFEDSQTDLDQLYMRLLGRGPSERERALAVKVNDGSYPFFPNCFVLAMHPDFILAKRGGSK